MAVGKFTEILDDSVRPVDSSRNVSLEHILAQSYRRTSSSSSGSDKSSAASSPVSTSPPAKGNKLRRFTLNTKPRT